MMNLKLQNATQSRFVFVEFTHQYLLLPQHQAKTFSLFPAPYPCLTQL